MIDWLRTSLILRISGLSIVLLLFLLLTISYSVFKLQQIDSEMREVAEVDIPLTEIMTEIELLQLKQHLLMEILRHKVPEYLVNAPSQTELSAQFDEYNRRLTQEMDKAVSVVQSALTKGKIRVKISEHRSVIQSMLKLHKLRFTFEQAFMEVLADALNQKPETWERLEQLDDQLDEQVETLLLDFEALTVEISEYAEKHQHEFVVVNLLLGFSGFCIGVYLTFFIIHSLRKRFARIRGQLNILHHSIASTTPLELDSLKQSRGKDELADFEKDLKTIMSRLSQEMNNRQEVEQQLIELATRDKLTGAYNRHKWDEQLLIELNLAARGTDLSLLLVDVDFFKRVNDDYGHDTGDRVLRALVTLLKKNLRQSDWLFRIGGEEFAILLRQIARSDALNIAEKLRMSVEAHREQGQPQLTVSIGVSSYCEGDDTLSLLKRADQALYQAKNNGRNRIEIC